MAMLYKYAFVKSIFLFPRSLVNNIQLCFHRSTQQVVTLFRLGLNQPISACASRCRLTVALAGKGQFAATLSCTGCNFFIAELVCILKAKRFCVIIGQHFFTGFCLMRNLLIQFKCYAIQWSFLVSIFTNLSDINLEGIDNGSILNMIMVGGFIFEYVARLNFVRVRQVKLIVVERRGRVSTLIYGCLVGNV